MNILDFSKLYTLHDSLIEEIQYDSERQKLIFKIDFCFWMQDGYQDTDPETGILYLSFSDVPNYENICGEIDCYSILDFSFHSGVVTINVLDDYHNEMFELCFRADDVEVTQETEG